MQSANITSQIAINMQSLSFWGKGGNVQVGLLVHSFVGSMCHPAGLRGTNAKRKVLRGGDGEEDFFFLRD